MNTYSRDTEEITGSPADGLLTRPLAIRDVDNDCWHIGLSISQQQAELIMHAGYEESLRALVMQSFGDHKEISVGSSVWHFLSIDQDMDAEEPLTEFRRRYSQRHLLPTVIYESRFEQKAQRYLYVSECLEAFVGHFPSHPILPGVVQLDWAIRLGAELGAELQNFSAIPRVKFSALTLPDTVMKLTVELNNTSLSFCLESAAEIHSQGVIRFG